MVTNGSDPNGAWTLTVGDSAAGDVGTMIDWSLTFTQLAPEPPIINCPMDITVTNDAGVCGAIVNFADAAVDPGGGTVTVTQNRWSYKWKYIR